MASCNAIVGLVMLILALIGTGVSIGTPFWTEGTEYHSGLWQQCTGSEGLCEFIQMNSTDVPRWFNPVRIVSAVAGANAFVAILFAIGYLCCSCCQHSIKAVQLLVLVLVVGCLELSISVVVYVVNHTDLPNVPSVANLGWSFYLAAASALLYVVNIIIFVCETSNAGAKGASGDHADEYRVLPTM